MSKMSDMAATIEELRTVAGGASAKVKGVGTSRSSVFGLVSGFE